MTQIATFASSDQGQAFARIEQRWGRDPAAFLEPYDDVLAHNLRAALWFALDKPEPEDPHRAAIEKLRG